MILLIIKSFRTGHWPWQCRRLGYNSHTPDDLPKKLYFVQGYSGDIDNERRRFRETTDHVASIKAHCYRDYESEPKDPVEPWKISPDMFRSILHAHINLRDSTEEMIRLSAYSKKKRAREYAQKHINEYEFKDKDRKCRMMKISTDDPNMAIYKALDLLKEFHVDLTHYARPGCGDSLLIEDQYLILHKIPASAIVSVKTYVCPERQYSQVPFPLLLGSQGWWQEYKLEHPPKWLYRIIHDCGAIKAGPRNLGTDHDESGLWTRDQTYLDDMTDEELWKRLRLHLNWNKDEILWKETHCIFISTFRDKQSVARRVRDFRNNHGYDDSLSLITIDTTKAELTTLRASAIISGMQIPLKPDLQAADFKDEYLVLLSIPQEAVVKTVPILNAEDISYDEDQVFGLGSDDVG